MNAPVQHSILVIEDDSVLNRLLLKTLVRSGFDMHGALTWAEARARIDEIAPDLVLLDMNLPDARDFTPLTEIVQTRPVIMLTAYGSINLENSVAHLICISEQQSQSFWRLDGGQRVLQVGTATLPDRSGI